MTGNLTLQGGALLVGSGIVVVNGGAGTLENMAGTISPGDHAAGMLTIRGTFISDAQGTVNLDIGGGNPGSGYDQLSVSGRITLNGTANVNFLDSYVATVSITFPDPSKKLLAARIEWKQPATAAQVCRCRPV